MNKIFLTLTFVVGITSFTKSAKSQDAIPDDLTMLEVGSLAYRVGSVAPHTFAYTNCLTNSNLVSSNFTDYTTVDSDYVNNPEGGSFESSTNGLQLISTNPNYVEGLVTYNNPLKASNNWTVTIQSHISSFTNNQTNPFYCAGISVAKITTNGLDYPNRVDLNLFRTGVSGGALMNSIVSGIYINNGEYNKVVNMNVTDVYLRFNFTARTKTLVSSYSTNGSNYTKIQSYNLKKNQWNLKTTESLLLGLASSDQPDGRVIPNYSVIAGQIYLKNLTVISTNNSQISSGVTPVNPNPLLN